MQNIQLILSYDGTDFLGWQKTNLGNSIEGCLEQALEMILQEKIQLQAASRTDAGVHAEGQVVNFRTNKSLSSYRLNQVLPPSIRILSLEIKEPSFHPTLDCVAKEYRYRISNTNIQFPMQRKLSWFVPGMICLDTMRQGVPYLLGERDFSSLCNQRINQTYKTHLCHLESIAIIEDTPGEILICLKGDRFLYKMARNIVGTLVYLGRGKMTLQEISCLLEKKDRTLAGPTAPAHGLFLHKVFYN